MLYTVDARYCTSTFSLLDDDTRVPLTPIDIDPTSDYINANYINVSHVQLTDYNIIITKSIDDVISYVNNYSLYPEKGVPSFPQKRHKVST